MLYNGGWDGLMGFAVLVMSEAGVKLYRSRDSFLLKCRRLVPAVLCWQVMSSANTVI